MKNIRVIAVRCLPWGRHSGQTWRSSWPPSHSGLQHWRRLSPDLREVSPSWRWRWRVWRPPWPRHWCPRWCWAAWCRAGSENPPFQHNQQSWRDHNQGVFVDYKLQCSSINKVSSALEKLHCVPCGRALNKFISTMMRSGGSIFIFILYIDQLYNFKYNYLI